MPIRKSLETYRMHLVYIYNYNLQECFSTKQFLMLSSTNSNCINHILYMHLVLCNIINITPRENHTYLFRRYCAVFKSSCFLFPWCSVFANNFSHPIPIYFNHMPKPRKLTKFHILGDNTAIISRQSISLLDILLTSLFFDFN